MKFVLTMAVLGSVLFGSQIVMYKSPTCGCCTKWALKMKDEKFDVKEVGVENVVEIKKHLRIPLELSSCHTAMVDGYIIEGHVPANEVQRLLNEKPSDIVGLSVPGMPIGSPGMEQGNLREKYDVLAILKDGSTKVYARYQGNDKID